MKKILIVALIVFTALFTTHSCVKDEVDAPKGEQQNTEEVDTVAVRLGGGDNIFYRGSSTMDNYLLASKPRTHTVFNSAIIDSIKFEKGSLDNVNIQGLEYRHYKIKVTFKDNYLPEKFTAYSKDTVSEFTTAARSLNLLKDQQDLHFIKYVKNSDLEKRYNEWRGTTYLMWGWTIYKDYKEVAKRIKDPIDKIATQFQPPHKN